MPSWKNGVELAVGGGGDVGVLDDLTNTIYVDSAAPSGGDGSKANPYQTITAATDRADTLYGEGSITSAAPCTIYIAPGTYVENVYLRTPYTRIIGAGRGLTTIAPTSGFGLYWGNATKASVASLVGAGNAPLANLETNYGDLTADGAVSSLVGSMVRGLTISYHDLNTPVLAYVGVGNGFDTSYTTRTIVDCELSGSVYLRNASRFMIEQTKIAYFLYQRQVRRLDVNGCPELYTLNADFNTSDPRSASPYDADSLLFTRDCQLTQDLVLSGAVALDADDTRVFDDIAMSDNATATLKECYVGDDVGITGTGTPSLTLKSVHIDGALTIATGGTKTVTIQGGQVMGAILDPDSVIVFVAPSLSVASPTPMHHLKLEEGTGLTANDSGPLGHNGTLSAGCAWVAGENGGWAVEIPNGESIALATGITTIRFDAAARWELQMRVKMDDGATPGPAAAIGLMHRTSGGFDAGGEKILYVDTSGDVNVANFGAAPYSLLSAQALRNNAWHTVTLRYNGYALMLYVDGVLQASDGIALFTATTADITGYAIQYGSGTLFPGNNNLYLGWVKYFWI